MKYDDRTIYLTNKPKPYEEIAEFIVKPESDKVHQVIVGSVLGVFIGCLLLMIVMMIWSYSLSYSLTGDFMSMLFTGQGIQVSDQVIQQSNDEKIINEILKTNIKDNKSLEAAFKEGKYE